MPITKLKKKSSSKSLRLKSGRPKSSRATCGESSHEGSKPCVRMSSKATSKSDLKQHLGAQTETQQVITIEAQTENLYSHTVALQTEYIRRSNILRHCEKKPTRYIIVEHQEEPVIRNPTTVNYLHPHPNTATTTTTSSALVPQPQPPASLNRYPVRKFAGTYSAFRGANVGAKKSTDGSQNLLARLPSTPVGKSRQNSSRKLTGRKSSSSTHRSRQHGKRAGLRTLYDEMSSQFARQQPDPITARTSAGVTTDAKYLKPRPFPPQSAWLPGSYLHPVAAVPNVIFRGGNNTLLMDAGHAVPLSQNNVRANNNIVSQEREAYGSSGILHSTLWHPAIVPRVAPTVAQNLSPQPQPVVTTATRPAGVRNNQHHRPPTPLDLTSLPPNLAMAWALGIGGSRWNEDQPNNYSKTVQWGDKRTNPISFVKTESSFVENNEDLTDRTWKTIEAPIARVLRYEKPKQEHLYWNPREAYANLEQRELETVQNLAQLIEERKRSKKGSAFVFSKKAGVIRNDVRIHSTT